MAERSIRDREHQVGLVFARGAIQCKRNPPPITLGASHAHSSSLTTHTGPSRNSLFLSTGILATWDSTVVITRG